MRPERLGPLRLSDSGMAFVMPYDFEGCVDPKVAADFLDKVELEDPPVFAPDVCFVEKDDWCTTQTARNVAGPRFL